MSFAYDANGNRTEMTDGQGTESYGYDALDRLTSVTRGADVFSYGYDPASNLTGRTYPDGTVFSYAFDDDGRLSSLTVGGQTTGYAYDAAGNLVEATLPNGYVETRSYDRAGRLTAVENALAGEPLSSFAYTLDAVGNPIEVAGLDAVLSYGYDAGDRLTSALCTGTACASAPSITFAYDAVGNRTSETRLEGTTTYSYDAADELTSESGPGGSVSYGYDASGNQTQAGSRTFGYDLANRLVSTSDGASTVTYAYDGDGKRVQAAGAQTVNYVWDPNAALPLLALERDGQGALLRRYAYGADLVSMTTGGGAFYYLKDGLGSVVNLTDAAGLPQWSYSYEPYGSMRLETQADPTAPTNPMRFTGYDANGNQTQAGGRSFAYNGAGRRKQP